MIENDRENELQENADGPTKRCWHCVVIGKGERIIPLTIHEHEHQAKESAAALGLPARVVRVLPVSRVEL